MGVQEDNMCSDGKVNFASFFVHLTKIYLDIDKCWEFWIRLNVVMVLLLEYQTTILYWYVLINGGEL